jgi:hypothetical protein
MSGEVVGRLVVVRKTLVQVILVMLTIRRLHEEGKKSSRARHRFSRVPSLDHVTRLVPIGTSAESRAYARDTATRNLNPPSRRDQSARAVQRQPVQRQDPAKSFSRGRGLP